MTDALQTTLHSLAVHHPSVGRAAVFLADELLFVLAAGWIALLVVYRNKVTRGFILRSLAALLLTGLMVVLLGHLITDPRPYLAEGYTPLTRVAADNGFPSDHTLVAAFLTGLLFWISRRWWPIFAALVVLIGLSRLAVGAHHTLDVLGSILLVAVAVGAVSWLRLPAWALLPLLSFPSTKLKSPD